MASPSRSPGRDRLRIAQGPQATRRRGRCHTHKIRHTSQPLSNTSATKTHMALIGARTIRLSYRRALRVSPVAGLAATLVAETVPAIGADATARSATDVSGCD